MCAWVPCELVHVCLAASFEEIQRRGKVPVLSLYIQRCNHDHSATQNLTPISRCFKYIFSHFYPYFAQNGYKLALKNTPIFRIPSTLLLNHPYFRNFKYTFTKPPLFYKSFIYIFFVLTRSLREPGGPCTKSMEVSESRMERVKKHFFFS